MSTHPQPEPVASVKTESGPAEPSGPLPARARFPVWLLAVLLGLVTLALYWPVVHYGYINYDDPDYVTGNRHVESGLTLHNMVWAFTTSHAANWHPLTWISLMADVSVFGKKAGGMHFTNLFLHAANGILLFLLLRQLTGAVWRSAMAAALFAWHPVHIESVAWVTERKDVLSTLFGFLTLIFFVQYAMQSEIRSRELKVGKAFYRSPAYWLAWFCFALGLMSKPMLVTLPFILLLLDFWPMERLRVERLGLLVGEKIPFFALGIAASVTTYLVQGNSGVVVAVDSLPLRYRIGNALIAYCNYLSKMFWPTDLTIFYPHPGVWPITEVLLALAFLIVISAFFLTQWRRFPFLIMGWLWYCGTLVPVIGLVQVGRQAMADRYTYIPSVGIIILVVWGLFELVRHRPAGLKMLSVMAVLTIAFCVFLTRQQLTYWQNSETLFRHSLAVTKGNFVAHFNLGATIDEAGRTDEAINEYKEAILLQPGVPAVHNNLGAALIKKGRLDEGIAEVRECLRLMPDYGLAVENLGNGLLAQGHVDAAIKAYEEGVRLEPEEDAAIAHYNLGVALNQAGQTEAAIREFQKTLSLEPEYGAARRNLSGLFGKTGQTNAAVSLLQDEVRLNPRDIDAHYNLANVLVSEGRIAEAINEFQADVRLKPDDADAHYNLGKAYLDQGQADTAINEFQSAFRYKKYDAEVHYNLGNLLAKKGLLDAAMAQFRETIRLEPNNVDAHNNLGNLLAKTGQSEAAIHELQEAVRLKPGDADALYNLGYALLKTGRMDDAISQFQAAIRLKPNFAPAHYNLAIALNKNGQIDPAIAQFEEAIRLQPDYAIAHNSLGALLTAQGRMDEAIAQFQAALRIKPDYGSAQNNLTRALEAKGK